MRASLVTAVALGLCSSALAQDLERARHHYLSAEFEEAAAAFVAVLDSPGLQREDAIDAHRYLAVLRSLLGDAERAHQHARSAVALDLAVAAPEGAPPEVGALFDEARREIARPARLAVEADGAIGETATVVARLEPAPGGLVDVIELRCASGVELGEADGAPPEVRVEVRVAADTVLCRAAARTRGGASLFSARAELTAGDAVARSLESTAAGGGGDEGWIVLGVASGLAVAGAVVAVVLAFALQGSAETAMLGAPRIEGW